MPQFLTQHRVIVVKVKKLGGARQSKFSNSYKTLQPAQNSVQIKTDQWGVPRNQVGGFDPIYPARSVA
jgi:hypothetical protein